jgi:hypothetical protein
LLVSREHQAKKAASASLSLGAFCRLTSHSIKSTAAAFCFLCAGERRKKGFCIRPITQPEIRTAAHPPPCSPSHVCIVHYKMYKRQRKSSTYCYVRRLHYSLSLLLAYTHTPEDQKQKYANNRVGQDYLPAQLHLLLTMEHDIAAKPCPI